MALTLKTIHSYLVHAGKHEARQPAIKGTDVPLAGKLFDLLKRIFDGAERECTHDITFDPSHDGKQVNPCRDLVVEYLRKTTLRNGQLIAERLQQVTTGKSGLGLLFLLSGKHRRECKIVLSRFPADSAILAEEAADGLTVEFLEKVFMKSATAYKAAVYRGSSTSGEFWDGRAIDKQINHEVLAISNYWIKEFLASDFRATSAQGTKRLATVIIAATKTADDVKVKQELVAAAQLALGLKGKTISINDFCKKFALSSAAANLMSDQCQNDAMKTERFRFSDTEFEKHIAIRSVEMNTGAIMMAPADEFDKVFTHETINQATGEQRFSTQGNVVDERLKRSR